MTCVCVCVFCSLIHFPNKYHRKSATVDGWSDRGRPPVVIGERCGSCAMQRSWGHVQPGWFQTSVLSFPSVPCGSWMSVLYHHDCCQASTCPFILTLTLKIKSGPINKSMMHPVNNWPFFFLNKKAGWQQKSTLVTAITWLKSPPPSYLPIIYTPSIVPMLALLQPPFSESHKCTYS